MSRKTLIITSQARTYLTGPVGWPSLTDIVHRVVDDSDQEGNIQVHSTEDFDS